MSLRNSDEEVRIIKVEQFGEGVFITFNDSQTYYFDAELLYSQTPDKAMNLSEAQALAPRMPARTYR